MPILALAGAALDVERGLLFIKKLLMMAEADSPPHHGVSTLEPHRSRCKHGRWGYNGV
jgi:hypothetical protein